MTAQFSVPKSNLKSIYLQVFQSFFPNLKKKLQTGFTDFDCIFYHENTHNHHLVVRKWNNNTKKKKKTYSFLFKTGAMKMKN
jgi:hypothetical protein